MTHKKSTLKVALLITLIVFGFTSLPTLASGQRATQPFDLSRLKLGETTWYGVYVANAKSGHSSSGYEKQMKYGKPIIAYHDDMFMKIQSDEQVFEMTFETRLEFSAQAPYQLIKGTSLTKDETGEVKVTAVLEGMTLKATISSDGETQTASIENFNYLLTDASAVEQWNLKNAKVGNKITLKELDLSEVSLDRITYQIKKITESNVDGVPARFYETTATSKELGEVGTFLFDGNSEIVSAKIGGFFELKAESEAVAKELQPPVDIFAIGTLRLSKPIGDPDQIKSLRLKINEKLANAIKVGPFQNATKQGQDYFALLGEQYGKKVPATQAEIQENSKATTTYQINHPTIEKLTREAIGTETDVKQKVARLVAFVSDYVEDSDQGDALTVIAVCKNKKGDCSDHALLFTTMARAAGVPCREVSGFVYMGDDYKSFGGHAWNEVVIDGHWWPVDPTWNELKINPTHIQLKKEAELSAMTLGMQVELNGLEKK